jgi:hypothetical protein
LCSTKNPAKSISIHARCRLAKGSWLNFTETWAGGVGKLRADGCNEDLETVQNHLKELEIAK